MRAACLMVRFARRVGARSVVLDCESRLAEFNDPVFVAGHILRDINTDIRTEFPRPLRKIAFGSYFLAEARPVP